MQHWSSKLIKINSGFIHKLYSSCWLWLQYFKIIIWHIKSPGLCFEGMMTYLKVYQFVNQKYLHSMTSGQSTPNRLFTPNPNQDVALSDRIQQEPREALDYLHRQMFRMAHKTKRFPYAIETQKLNSKRVALM